jgi:hypothetical protein
MPPTKRVSDLLSFSLLSLIFLNHIFIDFKQILSFDNSEKFLGGIPVFQPRKVLSQLTDPILSIRIQKSVSAEV